MKIFPLVPTSSSQLYTQRSFHIVDWSRTVPKCTEVKNSCGRRAKKFIAKYANL